MSVERIPRKDGAVVYRVRWRDAGRNRSRVYSTKRDAQLADVRSPGGVVSGTLRNSMRATRPWTSS